ncbi:MAG: hypothetical protein ACU843_00525 [Gammaproteobacteria bacterium]
MRIDAIIVLALGAIGYLKFMIQLYDNVFLAVAVFLVSGSLGLWLGLSSGEAREETHPDGSG